MPLFSDLTVERGLLQVPIYEYECNNCRHKLEAIQKVSDAPLLTCPECSKDSLRKLISAAAFHLKGSGWYVTDFRDKQKKNTDKKGDAAEKTGDAKPESKPDAPTADTGSKDAGSKKESSDSS